MEKRYPFPFLNAYQREDGDFFFGRDDEIEILYQLTQQSSIALVYGTSGTGKTSLIRCGLSNKFKSYDWLELCVRRGENLVASTDKRLCEASGGAFVYSDFTSPQYSVENLKGKIEAVYRTSFKPIYIIFDQFEELFILGEKKEEKAFTALLQNILFLKQPVKAIISIREEYLGYLFDLEQHIPDLLRKKLRVEPMGIDKIIRVLAGVDKNKNSLVHLREGETEAIAREIFYSIKGDEIRRNIDLPYFQVFLDRFYVCSTGDEARTSACTFSLSSLRQLPEFGDVLRNFLDAQVSQAALDLNQNPEQFWQILSAFVTVDGTKEPLTLHELVNRLPDKDQLFLNEALSVLANRRILRFDESNHRYEVAHDSLARQIHSKRNDEEIALLELQRLIKSHVALKPKDREFFTEKQLQLIESYLSRLRISTEERAWIERSSAYHQLEKEAAEREARDGLERALQQAELERSLKEGALKAQEETESARLEAENQKLTAESNARRAKKMSNLANLVTGFAIFLAIIATVQAHLYDQQAAAVVKEKQENLKKEKELNERQNSIEQLEKKVKDEKATNMILNLNYHIGRATSILRGGLDAKTVFQDMLKLAQTREDSIMIDQKIDSLQQIYKTSVQ